jgi:hypothetical protein
MRWSNFTLFGDHRIGVCGDSYGLCTLLNDAIEQMHSPPRCARTAEDQLISTDLAELLDGLLGLILGGEHGVDDWPRLGEC